MLNNATCFDRIVLVCGYTDLRCGIDGLVSALKSGHDIPSSCTNTKRRGPRSIRWSS